MDRAALQLMSSGDDARDLRIPIALALIELYGDDLTTDEIALCVAVMVPIEAAELDPRGHLETAP